MTTTRHPTTAEINARRSEIGAELAKWRITPHPNARTLEAEDAALVIEYREAEARESEAKAVAEGVERARLAKLTRDREARIEKAVADAMR